MDNKVNAPIQNSQYQKQLRDKIAQQDIYKAFVLNANSIAPQEHRAYLLKSRNPVSSFIIATADTGKDVVELGKALATGKSNDNQLGRFNDLGMKLGSLGIASYLFTKRGTGTKGLMEFIGAGAFFASMAAWPRLFISEPLKLRFGFDIRQQYVDAQGRKKRLFLDNQFIPDLYSNEEIDKIADKMGVDKKLPDYRELTKEKMRTGALQGNTLWMLTAGFSPLLTSMICNLAERGVTKYIINSQYNKILKGINNPTELVNNKLKDKNFNSVDSKQVKQILENRTAAPDEKFLNEISTLFDPFKVMINAKDVDDANLIAEVPGFAPDIRNGINQKYLLMKNQDAANGMLKIDEIVPLLKRNLGGVSDLQGNAGAQGLTSNVLKELIKVKNQTDSNGLISVKQLENIFDSITDGVKNPDEIKRLKNIYNQCVEMQNASPETIKQFYKDLLNVYETQVRPISARTSVYADFINGLVGQKYESVHTGIHMRATQEFVKAAHIPTKELKIARQSAQSSRKILEQHLSKIAADEQYYKIFISDLTEQQSKYEAATVDNLLKQIKQKISNDFNNLFRNIPDDSPLAFLKGEIGPVSKKRATVFEKAIDLFVEEKGAGIRATGHRYLLEADFEKRLQSGELQDYWKYLTGQDKLSDRVIKICRNILYDSSMNDLSNKFYLDKNGDEATNIIKLLFKETDMIANNSRPYGRLAQATSESCNPALLKKLQETRENFFAIYSQTVDFARRGHEIPDVKTNALSKTQYAMLGKAGSDLLMETASKMYNDRHWFKIFGTLTGVAIGATLITQLFFGKARNEHLYKNKKENGGVKNASK